MENKLCNDAAKGQEAALEAFTGKRYAVVSICLFGIVMKVINDEMLGLGCSSDTVSGCARPKTFSLDRLDLSVPKILRNTTWRRNSK